MSSGANPSAVRPLAHHRSPCRRHHVPHGTRVLHAAWSLGSHWPAASGPQLADAVVGAQVPPARTPTVVVAVGLLCSAAAVSGSLGRPRRPAAVALGGAFALRAALGGSAAARSITSTAPSARFVTLDRRLYRPLCAAIAAALLVSAVEQGTTSA